MSRRRAPRKSWAKREAVVTVVCSDKGQHDPPRVLGKINIGAEDWQTTVDNFTLGTDDSSFRDGFTSEGESVARSTAPLSPEAVTSQVRAMSEGHLDPHFTDRFQCRKCGRDIPVRRNRLAAAARTLHENGHHRLDLSHVAAILGD